MRFNIAFVITLFFSGFAIGEIYIGTGANSATGGRLVPSLNFGIGSDKMMFLASSTGVATESYFHSAYTLSAYWKKRLASSVGGLFLQDLV